jgi:hypothetical protein
MRQERRKTVGGMLLLTVMGTLLMLPPAVYVFSQPHNLFGIPQIVFYLFVLWFVMIVGTALLARSAPPDDDDSDSSEGDR